MKKKIKHWFRRYLPAEIFAAIGALLGAGVVFFASGNRIMSAYAGTLCENLSFYAFFSFSEFTNDIRKHKNKSKAFGFKGFMKTLRNMVFEFGPSEIVDSLIVRPFCFYLFPLLIGNYAVGVIVGKVVADIIFYIPVIMFYELRKQYLG